MREREGGRGWITERNEAGREIWEGEEETDEREEVSGGD